MLPIIPLFSLGGVGGNALQCPTIDETTRVDKILDLDIKIGSSPLLRLAMGKCGIRDGCTVSAAGGFGVYTYTRARVRVMFRKQNKLARLGLSFLFRKQNTAVSKHITLPR